MAKRVVASRVAVEPGDFAAVVIAEAAVAGDGSACKLVRSLVD